jgi:crossover junction endodeoxyribonuclease RusA
MASAKGLKPLMGLLAVRIDIFPPDERRRDTDNVQKSVLDALQHAGLFWDDSQVVWLLSIKHKSKPKGQIKVQLDDAAAQALSPAMEIA